MPDYHPDLDPFAHRDDESASSELTLRDGDTVHLTYTLRDGAHVDGPYSVTDRDGRYLGAGRFHVTTDRELVIDYFQPAEGRAPARSKSDRDLRVPAGREPDGDHQARRDAELQPPGGEPGAGAPAVPGRGAVRDLLHPRTYTPSDVHAHYRGGAPYFHQHDDAAYQHFHPGLSRAYYTALRDATLL